MERLFQAIEHFDQHAPIDGNGFAEFLGVEHRFPKDVGEACRTGRATCVMLRDCVGGEFAVKEPLYGSRVSCDCPAIKQHSFE